ncbi:DUF3649 domain-containing protein [Alcaligenaceae bacterium C4P045]|nr:DUF3649 domain-containing protein [Alcaligenaceae bacterium C4P045]
MRTPAHSAPWGRYRAAVFSRAIAAIFGGYVAASASAACLAVWLPVSRVDAVTAGLTMSFVIYTCVVLWVFAVRDAWRAWKGVLWPVVVFGGLFALKRWVLGV